MASLEKQVSIRRAAPQALMPWFSGEAAALRTVLVALIPLFAPLFHL